MPAWHSSQTEGFIFQFGFIEPNSDCNYSFQIYLTPNRIPSGPNSIWFDLIQKFKILFLGV